MRYHCFIELPKSYRFSKELFNATIPISVNGVSGKLLMPDYIDDIINEYGDLYNKNTLKEKKYAGHEDSFYYHLTNFYCEFYNDENIDRDAFYNNIKYTLNAFFDLLECYPKKNECNNVSTHTTKSNKFKFSLIPENEKPISRLHFSGDIWSDCSNNINNCINRYTLLRLLQLIKYNAKPILEFLLLREAKDMLENKNNRYVIINCCTICEIVFSKLLVDKLTKNGSKKEDIEKILNNINGIVALRMLLKEFKINTIKSDFFVLAKLRNKAAHMGISPTVEECNEYIKDCEALLKFHRIKFYEIEK